MPPKSTSWRGGKSIVPSSWGVIYQLQDETTHDDQNGSEYNLDVRDDSPIVPRPLEIGPDN